MFDDIVKSQTHWPGQSDAWEWLGVTTAIEVIFKIHGYSFGAQDKECNQDQRAKSAKHWCILTDKLSLNTGAYRYQC